MKSDGEIEFKTSVPSDFLNLLIDLKFESEGISNYFIIAINAWWIPALEDKLDFYYYSSDRRRNLQDAEEAQTQECRWWAYKNSWYPDVITIEEDYISNYDDYYDNIDYWDNYEYSDDTDDEEPQNVDLLVTFLDQCQFQIGDDDYCCDLSDKFGTIQFYDNLDGFCL